jgi:hypothetical protein
LLDPHPVSRSRARSSAILTFGKPKKFKPSEYAATEKATDYLKFTVTVVNKSNKSSNKEAEQIFDSGNDLESTPETKVLKARESEFDVGFGVADPKDVAMEVALQDDFVRLNLLYST